MSLHPRPTRFATDGNAQSRLTLDRSHDPRERYVRTRMMAWAMRAQCRWQKAPLLPDETSRLHALRSLGILDTHPDESFDKYTRIVAAAFDVPIAVVSLVDEKRQWFKSCIGLNGATETSRDMAFCAHAILKPEPLIVPDALLVSIWFTQCGCFAKGGRMSVLTLEYSSSHAAGRPLRPESACARRAPDSILRGGADHFERRLGRWLALRH